MRVVYRFVPMMLPKQIYGLEKCAYEIRWAKAILQAVVVILYNSVTTELN